MKDRLAAGRTDRTEEPGQAMSRAAASDRAEPSAVAKGAAVRKDARHDADHVCWLADPHPVVLRQSSDAASEVQRSSAGSGRQSAAETNNDLMAGIKTP